MNPAHRPNQFLLQAARRVLVEAAHRPWLASLLARRTDWLARLGEHLRRLTRPQRLGLRRKLASGMAAALLLSAILGARPAYAAGVVGDGTPSSCTASALMAAQTGGGVVTFNCGAAPKTIFMIGPIVLNSNTTIDGGGLITLDGQNNTSFFELVPGVNVQLKNLVFVNGNETVGSGGAVFVPASATLAVSNCTFNSNSSSNGGGAIAVAGTATIDSSTFFGNSAGGGGAIITGGNLVITNSTLTGNMATWGGGVYVASSAGPTTITSSTISGNRASSSGGGLYSYTEVEMSNTIIALNTTEGAGPGPDCGFSGGSIVSQDYNISSTTSCSLSGPNDLEDITSGALNLHGLAPNGGPTQTMALASPSVAIDAIPLNSNGCTLDTSIDQRGAVRASGVDRGGSGCDIGAFEYGSNQNPTVVSLNSLTAASRPAQGLLVGLAVAASSALAGLAYAAIRRFGRGWNYRITERMN